MTAQWENIYIYSTTTEKYSYPGRILNHRIKKPYTSRSVSLFEVARNLSHPKNKQKLTGQTTGFIR